jgi:pSer/pThr/pTyr-binding forkhead associated (FHA) protein
MVQLCILSGQMAGDNLVVRHFPFTIGRAAENDFSVPAEGVWEQHLVLDFQKGEGFVLQTVGEAFAAVNEHPQTSARLRNGDIISFGSEKIQFWLAPVVQRGLRAREFCVWLLLATVTAFQIALICRLRHGG